MTPALRRALALLSLFFALFACSVGSPWADAGKASMSTQYNGQPSNVAASSQLTISSSTNANPSVVQTSSAHGLSTGDWVDISGHALNAVINGVNPVTVIDSTHFSVPVAGTTNGVNTGLVSPLSTVPAGYSIPSDGDPDAAASVNTALELLGDRTARLFVETGAFKLVNLAPVSHSGVTQQTVWLTASVSNALGWSAFGSALQTVNVNAGDWIEVDFSGTGQTAPDTTVGTIEFSLAFKITPPGAGPPTIAKITGSGQTVNVQTGSNGPVTPLRLQGSLTNVATTGVLAIFAAATADLGTTNTVNAFGIGDYTITVRVWRPTSVLQ
jgi:hypothetical protein